MPTGLTHAVVGFAVATAFLGPAQPLLVYGLSVGLGRCCRISTSSAFTWACPTDRFSAIGASRTRYAALLVSLLAAWAGAGVLGIPWWLLGACFWVSTASHGLLDGSNDAGLGLAYFAPFVTTRYFLPWRPIRTPYIGGQFFRHGPLDVLKSEIGWVWFPLAVVVAASLVIRWLS